MASSWAAKSERLRTSMRNRLRAVFSLAAQKLSIHLVGKAVDNCLASVQGPYLVRAAVPLPHFQAVRASNL